MEKQAEIIKEETKETEVKDDQLREDLILSAVNFLNDNTIKKSSLNKKVAFLESKGLTNLEIQEALARANKGKTNSNDKVEGNAHKDEVINQSGPPLPSYSSAPPLPPKPLDSWFDYFKASLVTGAVAYSIYGLTKSFIAPLFKEGEDAIFNEEKAKLDLQYEEAFKAIEQIKEDTKNSLKSYQEQNIKVDDSLTQLNSSIDNLKKQDEGRYLDMEKLWKEIELVKKQIPETFEKSRLSQDSLIKDLQNELAALKNILNKNVNKPQLDKPDDNDANLHRSSSFTTLYNSPKEANGINKKSIPAWQLSMFNAKKDNEVKSVNGNDNDVQDALNGANNVQEAININNDVQEAVNDANGVGEVVEGTSR